MFLVLEKLSELELSVSRACSDFIPFLQKRKYHQNQNPLVQIQNITCAYELFRKGLPQTVRCSLFSFSFLKQRVTKLLNLGNAYQICLNKYKITLLMDQKKKEKFDISAFFAVYMNCSRSLNFYLNQGIFKFYLAIVFFLLSLFLFLFSYLCMTSYFSYLFVVLSFCVGAYLIFFGYWSFLKSIIKFQDKIQKALTSQWNLLLEES